MKQANNFIMDMMDFDLPGSQGNSLWRACKPTKALQDRDDVVLIVPFEPVTDKTAAEGRIAPRRNYAVRLRAYGESAMRLMVDLDTPSGDESGSRWTWDESEMLELDETLRQAPLRVRAVETGWDVVDERGSVRAHVHTAEAQVKHWSDQLPPARETIDLTFFPDGESCVPLMSHDQFFVRQIESLPLAFIERKDRTIRTAFSFHAAHDERFAGTGERFAETDLRGRTILLENTDALGVNNRRAYKNVPFYVSSRPYGLFMHTSAHVRLSLADVSTRAAQGVLDDNRLDLFIIGGGSVERVLFNYRRITGFPRKLPVWSYGIWMSRMSYFSETEVKGIAQRLREEQFPCDVLHLDTGWFAKDWVCEWEFSTARFPDPPRFMRELRDEGFRVSLWQTPNIGEGNKLLGTAQKNRYLAPVKEPNEQGRSDFSSQRFAGQIDFSNPNAVAWYQGLLRNLLEMGAAAIKTDFGESVTMDADYYGMPARKLHNLYALLYQRAAYDVTEETTGDGIIWARAGWAGCQRYPVHWGGDCACTWDGLAGSIRGGLHLAMSGFGFWSHDVPGFHGVPEFMNSWPSDVLYVRWTQVGVFTSHMRYHGTSPREPFEYPDVADVVRRWWRLRYCLIPYLLEQAERVVDTGQALLAPLTMYHEGDPTCWIIDDQFYCGSDVLVAPIMNDVGTRKVYLPAGEWVDLWSGQTWSGGQWLLVERVPLEHMPVFVRKGAEVPVYPHVVACTDEMDPAKNVVVRFDDEYNGLAASVLGSVTGLS